MELRVGNSNVQKGGTSDRHRRGSTWIKALVALFVVILIAALLFPVFAQHKNGPLSQTIRNLKMLATAHALYAEDFDGHLPIAKQWMDSIVPYLEGLPKGEGTLVDPELPLRKDGQYGYAFFEPLSSVEIASVENPGEIPMLFQSTLLDRNATGDLDLLPDPPRNGRRNYFAFLDTSARSMDRSWPETPIVVKFKPKPSIEEEWDGE